MISKELFKIKLPTIDITRKSIEESKASVLKIYDIKNLNENYLASKNDKKSTFTQTI